MTVTDGNTGPGSGTDTGGGHSAGSHGPTAHSGPPPFDPSGYDGMAAADRDLAGDAGPDWDPSSAGAGDPVPTADDLTQSPGTPESIAAWMPGGSGGGNKAVLPAWAGLSG
jgi:hypothetical protein